MRAAAYAGLIAVGAVVGYAVGQWFVPRGGELETAVFPGLGTIGGGLIGLSAAITWALHQRRKDREALLRRDGSGQPTDSDGPSV